MTIGQLALAAKVNPETVRYYERIELMAPPSRTDGGHRAYEEEHIRRLSFIRRARDLGFSIDAVPALLALGRPEHRSCAQVKTLASAHLVEVRAKLADLARLEHILTVTIDQCSGEPSTACPVLDMLDASSWPQGVIDRCD